MRFFPVLGFLLPLFVMPDAVHAQATLDPPPLPDLPGHKITKCFRNLGTEPVPLPIRVPLGCDSADCCPGCAHGPLDWVIRLDGAEHVAVSLRYEGLSSEAAARLGTAARYPGLAVVDLPVTVGETVVRGIGRSDDPVVPVAIPVFSLGEDTVRRLGRGLAKTARAPLAAEQIRLEITQMLGPVVVARTKMDARISECMAPPVQFQTDFIRIENNRGARQVSIWLDARLDEVGCENDLPLCLTRNTSIRNIRSGCREVAAFSEDDGAVWQLKKWTDAPGDTLRINFPATINVPIRVWRLDPNPVTQPQSIADDLLITNALYDTEGCGTRFTLIGERDVSSLPVARSIHSGDRQPSCEVLKSRVGFDENAINLYYFDPSNQDPKDWPPSLAGFACPDNNGCGDPSEPILIINSQSRNPETVAHEIGHLFSLMHELCFVGVTQAAFDRSNLMFVGTTGRDQITAAQCFRVNFAANSWLNRGGLRDGPTRECVQEPASGSRMQGTFVPVVDNPRCPVVTNDIPIDSAIPPEIPQNQIFYPCGDLEIVGR